MHRLEVFSIGEREYRKDIAQRIQDCLYGAVNNHCKVFVVRIDVRFPHGFVHDGKNAHISELLRRLRMHYGFHGIDCHYVWAREQNKSGTPHYHVFILLNGSRIHNGWGVQELAAKIWADLLKVECKGCIELGLRYGRDRDTGIIIRRPSPRSTGEKLRVERENYEASYRAALDRGIYLAKTYTKGGAPHGVREFGSSRF